MAYRAGARQDRWLELLEEALYRGTSHTPDAPAALIVALLEHPRISPAKTPSWSHDLQKEAFALLRFWLVAPSTGGGGLVILDDLMKNCKTLTRDGAETPQAAGCQSYRCCASTTRSQVRHHRCHAAAVRRRSAGHLPEQEGWTLLKLPAIARRARRSSAVGPEIRRHVRAGGRRGPSQPQLTALEEMKRSGWARPISPPNICKNRFSARVTR